MYFLLIVDSSSPLETLAQQTHPDNWDAAQCFNSSPLKARCVMSKENSRREGKEVRG